MPTSSPLSLAKAAALDTIALSADASTLVAAGSSAGSELLAFAVAKTPPKAIAVKAPAEALHRIALSPDGSILYGATRNDVTRSRIGSGGTKTKAKAPPPLITNSANEVTAIALRSDGDVLATAVGDALMLWDTASGAADADEPPIIERRGSALAACAFAMEDTHIVGLNQKGGILILDGETLHRHSLINTDDSRLRTLAVCTAGAGDLVALGSLNPKKPIQVFSIKQKKVLFTLEQTKPTAKGGVTSLAFSPNGKRLASAGEDGHVRVWDVTKKKMIADLEGTARAVVFLDHDRVAGAGKAVAIFEVA